MRKHLRTIWSSCALLVLALVFTASVATTAVAQTDAAPGTGGTLSRSDVKLNLGTREEAAAELTDPVPFNILAEADEDMYLALLAFGSKYRIGLGVQDGDWVRYESTGDGPKETLELRATQTDAGELWIIETRTRAGKSTEMHALFSKGKPKLLRGFRIDESGARTDIEPLEDKYAGELFLEARQIAFDALGGNRDEFRVTGCGAEELALPFGTMTGWCLEVQVAEDADPLSFSPTRRWLSEGTLLWLNQKVPRLLPMSAAILPSLLAPDDMMTVPGGLVRSPYHVLVDYKGRS